jgi:hypothetical protein
MTVATTTDRAGMAQRESDNEIAASFRAAVHIYGGLGAPLYSTLCIRAADDPAMLDLASYALENGRPIHVFTAVHYLLLRDPSDPLSRFYATLTENPAPPEDAYPAFAAYCARHRDEILALMKVNTVQMTYVERCRSMVAPFTQIAAEAGEPINLIEIGCAAGILLTFDKYAYILNSRGRVGSASAPLTLEGELRGDPPLRIPKIGTRTGLDLHVVDVNSEEQRRWILASTYPENREQQKRLVTALDVVAQTDIAMHEGDALALLPGLLASMPSPLCVYHSACLMYWSTEAKDKLNNLLKDASRDRDIYRLSLEPSEQWDKWSLGRADNPFEAKNGPPMTGETIITKYSRGNAEKRVVARHSPDYGTIAWIG